MGRCMNCGGSTGLFSAKRFCGKCNNFFIADYQSALETFKRMNQQISKGYNSIESYMSRFKIALECVDRMINSHNKLPNKIKVSTTKEETLKQMGNILDNLHSRTIEKAYSFKTRKTTINKIIMYQEEIRDCLYDYDFLKSNLENNMNNAQEVLDILLQQLKDEKKKTTD